MKNPATSGDWNEFTQALYKKFCDEGKKPVMVKLRDGSYAPISYTATVGDDEEMRCQFEYRYGSRWNIWGVDGVCVQSRDLDMMEF